MHADYLIARAPEFVEGIQLNHSVGSRGDFCFWHEPSVPPAASVGPEVGGDALATWADDVRQRQNAAILAAPCSAMAGIAAIFEVSALPAIGHA